MWQNMICEQHYKKKIHQVHTWYDKRVTTKQNKSNEKQQNLKLQTLFVENHADSYGNGNENTHSSS